jgi:hypothetical protein
MLTTIKEDEKAKMKNNNNDENVFHFFLEYQQANEQPEEQELGIAHI